MAANTRRTGCAESTVVVVAVRRDGAVGYFDTAEVPDGWNVADTPRDIADVMASLGVDRKGALHAMNAHWQR